jgi:TrpR family transcriptional regulator, trp operon repressor
MTVYKLDEISKVLSNAKDDKRIEAFLNSLLTEKEIADISSRWELVKLLDNGMSQRKIASKLGLSLCKITRGSRELKKTNSPFKYFIDKLK